MRFSRPPPWIIQQLCLFLPPSSQLRLTAVEKGEERERGRGCRNSIAARFELTALEKEWRESPTLSSCVDA